MVCLPRKLFIICPRLWVHHFFLFISFYFFIFYFFLKAKNVARNIRNPYSNVLTKYFNQSFATIKAWSFLDLLTPRIFAECIYRAYSQRSAGQKIEERTYMCLSIEPGNWQCIALRQVPLFLTRLVFLACDKTVVF